MTIKNSISPSSPVRRDPLLARIFLRHVAKNLRRSWRNERHDAFSDAKVQIEVPLMVYSVFALALLEMVLSRTALPALGRLISSNVSYGGVIVLGLAMGIIWAVDRKLGRYESVPGAELAYDSARDRTLVWIYYSVGFIVIPVMIYASSVIQEKLPGAL